MARELDGVHCYPVDVDTCKCTLSWWRIHEQVPNGGNVGSTNPWDSSKPNQNRMDFFG